MPYVFFAFRIMVGLWSDEHIAASLNRMGLPTGQAVVRCASRSRPGGAAAMAPTATGHARDLRVRGDRRRPQAVPASPSLSAAV